MIGVTVICPPACLLLNNRLLTFFLLLLLGQSSLSAVEALHLRLGAIEAAGWSAEGAELTIEMGSGDTLRLRLGLRRLSAAAMAEDVTDVRLECAAAELAGERVHCRNGTLRLVHSVLPRPTVKVVFSWDWAQRQLDLKLWDVALLAGESSLSVRWDDSRWKVRLQGRDLELA